VLKKHPAHFIVEEAVANLDSADCPFLDDPKSLQLHIATSSSPRKIFSDSND